MELDEERTSAMALWTAAVSYHSAASFLCDNVSQAKLALPYHDPILLMLGHTFELAFKAKLRANGESLEALKDGGHDLESLLTAAGASNLAVDISIVERVHLTLLNSLHGRFPYATRYVVTGTRCEPDTLLLTQLARRVLDVIRAECLSASA